MGLQGGCKRVGGGAGEEGGTSEGGDGLGDQGRKEGRSWFTCGRRCKEGSGEEGIGLGL